MTREILFRGKRVDNGGWVYGFYLANINPHKEYNSFDNHFIYEGVNIKDAIEVHPSTVGQFTGLHDKDGNKIFEGDVVRCYDHPTDIDSVTGIVEFENGRYWTHDSRLISIDQYGSIWLTLLGNIHDNPELNQ